MPAARMVDMEQFGVAALALVAGTTALPVESALFEEMLAGVASSAAQSSPGWVADRRA